MVEGAGWALRMGRDILWADVLVVGLKGEVLGAAFVKCATRGNDAVLPVLNRRPRARAVATGNVGASSNTAAVAPVEVHVAHGHV